MGHDGKFQRDRNGRRRSYLLVALVAASTLAFGGCVWLNVGVPSRGTFRVVNVKDDGTLVVRGSGGREFGVKMYAIRLKEDWQRELRAKGGIVPRVIQLRNGPGRIIEKDGRLVYDQRCISRDPRVLVSLNIVEPDLVTPKRDEQGNILAHVAANWHPPIVLETSLIWFGVAEPNPDIRDDPIVDHLRSAQRSVDSRK